MAFNLTRLHLQPTASSALELCKSQYGTAGLKIEKALSDNVNFRPAFSLKVNTALTLAVAVDENVYPQILKIASHDIIQENLLVSLYAACPLESFQNDPNQKNAKMLKDHGFGLITVDAQGHAAFQFHAVPVIQHIREDRLKSEMKGLTQKLRREFIQSFETYRSNPVQGVQAGRQIVEAMIWNCCDQAISKLGVDSNVKKPKSVANTVDAMYAYGGAIGGIRPELAAARTFLNRYGNVASHPSQNAAARAQKYRKCREGFLSAVSASHQLCNGMRKLGLTIRPHI